MTKKEIEKIWIKTLAKIKVEKESWLNGVETMEEYIRWRKELEDNYMTTLQHLIMCDLIKFDEYSYGIDLMIYARY